MYMYIRLLICIVMSLTTASVLSLSLSLSTLISPQPSYVFCDRLLTPAPHHRQLRYCGDLDSQVEMKRVRFLREREEQERLGREEQERLAKE